ncbi:MAG: Fic family protein [Candidatus Babeliales bacterium]
MYSNKIKEIDELQKQINASRPLKKKLRDNLKEYFKIGVTYSSNALEGNSLTETETKIVLEDGLTIGGKPMRDHLEAIGHSQAYDLLYKLAKNHEIKEIDILKLHKLFYYHIDMKNAGKYRKQQVFITGTEFVPPAPKQVPALMKNFIESMASMRPKIHTVEFAALLHKELVTIHPFVDGNGRTARLVMNLALLQNGYVVTIIPPILRADYINLLKRTQVEPKDDKPFIDFISTMVHESQKDYLSMINAL